MKVGKYIRGSNKQSQDKADKKKNTGLGHRLEHSSKKNKRKK